MTPYALTCAAGLLIALALAASLAPASALEPDITATPSATPTLFPMNSPNAAWAPVAVAVDDLDLLWVPAGCFLLGSEQGDDDELPRRAICVSAFWIGRTVITNRQYARCVDAGACRPPHDRAWYDDPAYAAHPVVFVDWDQANAYAAWRGCALPTEAQWEYAARGPEGWAYPWGDRFDGSRLNFCDTNCLYDWRDPTYDDGFAQSAPAGHYERGLSWVGAAEMTGNVWEWVADWYDPQAYAALDDGTLDPSGPPTGLGRVVRGGSWASYQGYTRAASRDWDSPHLRFVVVGFRLACPPEILAGPVQSPTLSPTP